MFENGIQSSELEPRGEPSVKLEALECAGKQNALLLAFTEFKVEKKISGVV